MKIFDKLYREFKRFFIRNSYYQDIHKKAIIPTSVGFHHFGIGVIIGRNVRLGENVQIYQYVTIGSVKDSMTVIGNNCILHAYSIIQGGVVLPDNTIVKPGNVVFPSSDNKIHKFNIIERGVIK